MKYSGSQPICQCDSLNLSAAKKCEWSIPTGKCVEKNHNDQNEPQDKGIVLSFRFRIDYTV